MKTIITPRLELQTLVIKHADQLFELFQDVELYTFIDREPPPDREKFREMIAFLEKRESKDGTKLFWDWIAIDQSTQAIACFIEITLHRENRVCNLAYYTFRNHQRLGLAKEACAAVMEYLFREGGATKVVIEMDVLNTASVRLAESLGAELVAYKPAADVIRGRVSDEWGWEIRAM